MRGSGQSVLAVPPSPLRQSRAEEGEGAAGAGRVRVRVRQGAGRVGRNINFIDAGQEDSERVRGEDHKGEDPARQHAGDLPEAAAGSGAAGEGVRDHPQPARGRRKHGAHPQIPARHDAEGRKRSHRQVPQGGEPARGSPRKQEASEAREGDRAAHPPQKQAGTGGTSHPARAAGGHSQGAVGEAGGSDLREGSAAGGVQQDGGRHQEVQREHRRTGAGDREDAGGHHQEHSARPQHGRLPTLPHRLIVHSLSPATPPNTITSSGTQRPLLARPCWLCPSPSCTTLSLCSASPSCFRLQSTSCSCLQKWITNQQITNSRLAKHTPTAAQTRQYRGLVMSKLELSESEIAYPHEIPRSSTSKIRKAAVTTAAFRLRLALSLNRSAAHHLRTSRSWKMYASLHSLHPSVSPFPTLSRTSSSPTLLSSHSRKHPSCTNCTAPSHPHGSHSRSFRPSPSSPSPPSFPSFPSPPSPPRQYLHSRTAKSKMAPLFLPF